jgi:hypothetical protein
MMQQIMHWVLLLLLPLHGSHASALSAQVQQQQSRCRQLCCSLQSAYNSSKHMNCPKLCSSYKPHKSLQRQPLQKPPLRNTQRVQLQQQQQQQQQQ